MIMQTNHCKHRVNYKILYSIAFGVLVNTLKILIFDKFESTKIQQLKSVFSKQHKVAYDEWLNKQNVQVNFNKDVSVLHNNTVSEKSFLEGKIKVACFVFLSTYDFEHYVRSNNESHFGRCNKMYYVGSPKSNVKLANSSEHIKLRFIQAISWRIIRVILNVIFTSPIKFDWYVFSTKNTFLITENLRYYVSVLDNSMPFYLGHPVYQKGHNDPYNVFKSGIVLNIQALNALNSLIKSNKCSSSMFNSLDIELGACLAFLNIRPFDTKDEKGRHLFIYKTFDELFLEHYDFRSRWSHFMFYIQEPTYRNFDGPDNVISLLVGDQYEIELLNFYIYKWKSYGVGVPMMTPNMTALPSDKKN